MKAWWNPSQGQQRHESYLVRGTKVIQLAAALPDQPDKRFPAWNLGVNANRNSVKLANQQSGAMVALNLRHADDFDVWESLNVDRYGWLFAEGWGNDYAIKFVSRDHSIKAETIYRYTGRGWVGRLIEWMFGAGGDTPIDWTYYSAQCVDFSHVLALTLFCKPAKVLRDGKLADIGDGSAPLERYIGDATGARVALFKGTDGGLYAFDGQAVQAVADNVGRFMEIQDLPGVARTFVTAGQSAFEIKGRFPRLRLAAIDTIAAPRIAADTECCLSRYRLSASRFVTFPGTNDVLGFNLDTGVWLVGSDRAENIWQTRGRRIALEDIAPAAIWNGMIFLAMDQTPYLIRRCATENGRS